MVVSCKKCTHAMQFIQVGKMEKDVHVCVCVCVVCVCVVCELGARGCVCVCVRQADECELRVGVCIKKTTQ